MIFFDDTFPEKPRDIREKTLSWSGSDTYKRFRKNQPNPYTENSITYKYNEYGFRCDEFIPNEHSLVFLGCSFTEGIGLPIEETFSYLIHSEVQKRIGKKIPYWNLGLGGCGLDSIVRCYYAFYKRLNPRVVIAFFPSYRLEYYNDGWCAALLNHDPGKVFSRNPHLLNKHVIEYNTEKNLVMLDLLLEKNKTLFIWDKWDLETFDDIDVTKLDNFKNYANAWWTAVDKANPSPYARDGSHPGKRTNEEFAKLILDQYGDDICQRIIGAP